MGETSVIKLILMCVGGHLALNAHVVTLPKDRLLGVMDSWIETQTRWAPSAGHMFLLFCVFSDELTYNSHVAACSILVSKPTLKRNLSIVRCWTVSVKPDVLCGTDASAQPADS